MEIEGQQELDAALRRYGRAAEREVGLAVNATGLEVRGDIVKRIQQGPATGITYTRGNITHTASRAGEAPATDTGRLASSIDYRKTGAMSATVGSQVVYAAMLEFGTSRIGPRPAWVPAVEAARPKFRRRVRDALARAAR